MPDEQRRPVRQLTTRQLDHYGNQLTRCLKALGTDEPGHALLRDPGKVVSVTAGQLHHSAATQPILPSSGRMHPGSCQSAASQSPSWSAARSRTCMDGRISGLGGCKIASPADRGQGGKAWPRSP